MKVLTEMTSLTFLWKNINERLSDQIRNQDKPGEADTIKKER
jgi:hypothetical protein